MTYTVVWKPGPKRKLADLWILSDDRSSVASAADEIDRQLRLKADSAGESRAGTTRCLVIEPLAIYFDVSDEDRTATVFSLWRWS